LGAQYQLIEDVLKLGADLVHAESSGGTHVNGGVGFPDLETSRDTLSMYADYAWKENLDAIVHLRYEDYSESDWAYDGLGISTLSNVLGLGYEPPDYTIGVIGVSLRYKF